MRVPKGFRAMMVAQMLWSSGLCKETERNETQAPMTLMSTVCRSLIEKSRPDALCAVKYGLSLGLCMVPYHGFLRMDLPVGLLVGWRLRHTLLCFGSSGGLGGMARHGNGSRYLIQMLLARLVLV